jgi:hypothetical protein
MLPCVIIKPTRYIRERAGFRMVMGCRCVAPDVTMSYDPDAIGLEADMARAPRFRGDPERTWTVPLICQLPKDYVLVRNYILAVHRRCHVTL